MHDLITLEKRAISDGEVQTVNARELHVFLENGDRFASWIKDRIEQYGFVENQDFATFSVDSEKGRPRVEYAVTIDMAKELSMVERNEKGRQARRYFIECEKRAKASPLEMTRLELIQFALDGEKKRIAAESERDHAIATKAEIGTRREATAMNTASQAVKVAHKLEIELDRSKEYATVKRMEMQYHGLKFSWRLLKSTAAEMGIPAIDVFDANYGTVKAYHADVWAEAYALAI